MPIVTVFGSSWSLTLEYQFPILFLIFQKSNKVLLQFLEAKEREGK